MQAKSESYCNHHRYHVLSVVLMLLLTIILPAYADSELAKSEVEGIYQFLDDYVNESPTDNSPISEFYTILDDWMFYPTTGIDIHIGDNDTSEIITAQFGIIKFAGGISPLLRLTGDLSNYIDFSYYEIQIGNESWTIDLSNAPLYSYCSLRNSDIKNGVYGYLSLIPLGSAGVRILNAIKESGHAPNCRLYITGSKYYEPNAYDDAGFVSDYSKFYDNLILTGYLNQGGQVTKQTTEYLGSIDADISLPRILPGPLAQTIAMPSTEPQSTYLENAVSFVYYYFDFNDVREKIDIHFRFRNLSEQKTLEGYSILYCLLDKENGFVELDGQKTYTQTVSGLNVAPGEIFDTNSITNIDRNIVKEIFVVYTNSQFTDGSRVDIPKICYYAIGCDIRAYPKKIAINKGVSLLMDVGGKEELSFSLVPAFANEYVAWTSSDNNIATVDENGVVIAKAEGAARITAETVNDKKAVIKINVANLVHKLEIEGDDSISAGSSIKLTATVTDPENPTNSKVTWKSSDNKIASVSADGKVTAKKVKETSTVVITAIASDGSDTFTEKKITVYPVASKIDILDTNGQQVSGSKITLKVGQSLVLDTAVFPTDASKNIVWTSSNDKIVSISENGTIIANAIGKAVITVKTDNGKTNKVTFAVIDE
jgi:uncharacterized protein YjdB